MQQGNEAMVRSLAATVRNETKPAEERYDALKLICKIRGDAYQFVPESHLRSVVAGMMPVIQGMKPLTLAASAEAVAEGRARRERAAIQRA